MDLVDAIKKENRVHQRVLDLSTYALDDEKVMVEGSLRDERFRPIYEVSGRKREEGVVHHKADDHVVNHPFFPFPA